MLIILDSSIYQSKLLEMCKKKSNNPWFYKSCFKSPSTSLDTFGASSIFSGGAICLIISSTAFLTERKEQRCWLLCYKEISTPLMETIVILCSIHFLTTPSTFNGVSFLFFLLSSCSFKELWSSKSWSSSLEAPLSL